MYLLKTIYFFEYNSYEEMHQELSACSSERHNRVSFWLNFSFKPRPIRDFSKALI